MLGRAALVLGSTLLTLFVLELGCRVARGVDWLVRWPNLVLDERIATRANRDGRLMHDGKLGFSPRPGYAKDGVSYDAHGYRLTPTAAEMPPEAPPILVVGDSYAHGDELTDAETWASLVQPLVGRRTINAGVTGYGLDQIVLRAELAAGDVKPAAIVLAFIADDLRRSEMKRVWGVEKPYRATERQVGRAQRARASAARSRDDARCLATFVWLVGSGRYHLAPPRLAI
jgi:hypothetical protein